MLDKFVAEYKPTEYKRIPQKYDGHRWEYMGYMKNDSIGTEIGIGIEKNIRNSGNEKFAHHSFHFSPFVYRRILFDDELAVCNMALKNEALGEEHKKIAAKLIALLWCCH